MEAFIAILRTLAENSWRAGLPLLLFGALVLLLDHYHFPTIADAEAVLSNLATLTREQLAYLLGVLSSPQRRFEVSQLSDMYALISKRVLLPVGMGEHMSFICELHPAVLAQRDQLLPALKATLESGDPNVVLIRQDR
jgi:hypothetical protein